MKKLLWIGAAFALLTQFAGCSDSDVDTPPPAPAPVISVTQQPAPIAPAGGEVVLRIAIENPREGVLPTAESDQSWLTVTRTTMVSVICQASPHTGETARPARVTVSYPDAEPVTIDLEQTAAEPEDPSKSLTFDIRIVKASSRSVIVDCIPSDPEATYIAMATYKSDFEAHESEEALIEDNFTYFTEWGEAFGATTPEEALKMFLRRGPMGNYEIQLDRPEEDYYFYAYGLNADGTVTSSKIYKKDFRTTIPEAQECTFAFSVRPGIEYTQVGVFPSDLAVSYLWGVMSSAEYEALGSDPAQRIVDDIKAQIEADNALGGDSRFGDYVVYHNSKSSYKNLVQGEKYVVYAFGCDVKGYVTAPIMTETFTEERLQKVDCSFSLTHRDVRASSFTTDIQPSNDAVRWFAYTLPYEMLESVNSLEELSEEVIDIVNGMGIDWATDETYVHTGFRNLTNYDMMGSELDANTRHLVAVFGVNEKGSRITDIAQANVTTLAPDTPSTMTVDITGETKGWSGLALTFTPSAKERYFYDVQMKDFYESFESDEAFMNELLYYYGGQGLLAYKQTIGQATLTVEEGLLPGTTYLGVAFGVDKQISTPLFTREFTTASVPMGGTATVTSIEPTIEDGDRYYESDPEKYADCKGKAVVGFKITTNAAAKYYVACFDPFTERPTDQQMTDLLVGYGDSEPAAYLLDWNEPCEVWALAMDNAGKAGALKRLDLTPERSSVTTVATARPFAVRPKTARTAAHALHPMQSYTPAPVVRSTAPESDVLSTVLREQGHTIFTPGEVVSLTPSSRTAVLPATVRNFRGR